MTYRVEYKQHPTSSWTTYGGNYSEGNAYLALERAAQRGYARIVNSNGSVVATMPKK